jgi:electron transfer flavoprotein beta subunit
MKVLVSFKSVPDANDVAVAGAAVATPKSVINPFDEIAIEEALRIRERDEATEIEGVTIGVPAVDEQIRAALAMGVDRAIRIDNSSKIDPYAVERIIDAKVKKEAPNVMIIRRFTCDPILVCHAGTGAVWFSDSLIHTVASARWSRRFRNW